MAGKLLVRSYNVGCGDCIYLRIPTDDDGFHVLIDCGSKEGASSGVMKRAIRHLADEVLPPAEEDGKKRLDLIVVTHRHEDHIKGFDPAFFHDIAIGNIWITAAMNENHPQAKRSLALHRAASDEIAQLATDDRALSPELVDLVALYGINNEGATTALTESLPQANGIEPTFVHAGMHSTGLGIDIQDTMIHVLAPEEDIDHFYLGKEADDRLRSLSMAAGDFRSASAPVGAGEAPQGITIRDFRRLQSRMLSNGLAFAVDDTKIQNNVSTVILIEWKGRRLLFVGDAEWEDRFEEGRKNGSWNVMWARRKALLDSPIDFLKVGHHGSHNATPWRRDEDADHEVNQILDAILPLPAPGQKPLAKAVVSTKRKQYDTIPDGELLAELGRRVANVRSYLGHFAAADPRFDPEAEIFNYSVMKTYSREPSPREVGDKPWLGRPQPYRTDMESTAKGSSSMLGDVEFVDVEIDP